MRILFTGATGFLGKRLLLSLQPGWQAIVLTRQPNKASTSTTKYVQWDGKSIPSSVGEVDAIINLAGQGIVDKAWTDARKKELVESRVFPTKACVDYIQSLPNKPKLFLSSSAVGIYGADNPKVVDEDSSPGSDFLGELCAQWEEAAKDAGIRTVLMRISVVLDKKDGALPQIAMPFKWGLGGPIASGQQGFSWIHIEDLVRSIWFLLENEEIQGPVNLVAPELITNTQLTNALKKVLKRPAFFRVPKAILTLGMGERSILVWGGQKVLPKVLMQHEFSCKFPSIEAALQDIYSH